MKTALLEPLFTAAQTRAMDAAAIEGCGIPGSILMARAAPGYPDPDGAFISERVIASLSESLYEPGRDIVAAAARAWL